MKPVFIFLLSIFSVQLSYAQSADRTARHKEMISRLLQQHTDQKRTARTTSGTSDLRVAAQRTRDSVGVLTDSVKLFYAPNMGSTYDYNTMIYPYNYPYSTSPMFNFAGVFTKPQVLFDTCLHWLQDPFSMPGAATLYEATVAGYDGSQNLTSFTDLFTDSVTNTNMSFLNWFNSSNNIDTGYWFRLHAGVADTIFKQFFDYDGSGNLIKDSIYEFHLGNWHLVAKSLYTYDGMNNLTQINYFANDTDTSFTQPIFEKERYINTYDASDRLVSVLTKMYTGAALDSYVIDTFGYTAAYTFHTSWKEYQYDPINHYWAPMFRMSKVLNGSGRPDTVNIEGFDSLLNAWVPGTMNVVHYNTANYPDTIREYDYDFTHFPATPSYSTVYYYETYLTTTGLETVAETGASATIFPNPATNTFTISLSHTAPSSTLSYALMNVKGHVVQRAQMPMQTETKVSISDLVPGVYWIIVQDGNGKLLHKQAIVKQ